MTPFKFDVSIVVTPSSFEKSRVLTPSKFDKLKSLISQTGLTVIPLTSIQPPSKTNEMQPIYLFCFVL
jgi:hypothetical protein